MENYLFVIIFIMEQLEVFLKYAAAGIEYAGILIVIVASIISLIGILRNFKNINPVRRKFGEWILTGLEFIIAAEIISATLAFNREELLLLGAAVAIRTLLGYSLKKEISQ